MFKILILSLFIPLICLEISAKESIDENSSEIVAKKIAKSISDNSNESIEIAKFIAHKIADNNTSENDSNSLFDLIDELIKLNYKIEILSDSNETNGEISDINTQKDKILSQIPSVILNQSINAEQFLNYMNLKKSLEMKLKRYSQNKDSREYIENAMKFYKSQIGEIFYLAVLKLEKMSLDGKKKDEISSFLQNVLFDLQSKDYENFKVLSAKVSEDGEFNALLNEIKITKRSFEEILGCLIQNAAVLESNFVFNALNLGEILNFINSHLNLNKFGVNTGKIIIISIVMVLFYSLRQFLAKILLFIFEMLFFKEKTGSNSSRIEAIDVIKRPLGVLLIVYGLDICAQIFYYPLIVPTSFHSVFSVVYIICYAWMIIGILDGYGIILISKIAQKSERKEVINLIIKIAYVMIFIIAFLMVLSNIGFDISTIIASLGIGGLAVALATKDIIANFFASVMLLFDNSFSQGDWIVCGDVEGTVVEIGLRKTTIRTFDNALVFVPNLTIINQNIKNWNRRKIGRQIKFSVGLNYITTTQQLKNCVNDIKQMLLNHDGIAKPNDNSSNLGIRPSRMVSIDDLAGYKNTLLVYVDKFSDSSIDILVYCFSKTIVWAEFLAVKEDVMMKIMKIVEKNGANFAFPSQSIYIESLPKRINSDKVNKI